MPCTAPESESFDHNYVLRVHDVCLVLCTLCFNQHHKSYVFQTSVIPVLRNFEIEIYAYLYFLLGKPWWLSGEEPSCQCRRCWFDPWIRNIPMKKEMATNSGILAWKIPWTEELGRLQSMGSQKSGTQLSD